MAVDRAGSQRWYPGACTLGMGWLWLLVSLHVFTACSGPAEFSRRDPSAEEPWEGRYHELRPPTGGCVQLVEGQASGRGVTRRLGPSRDSVIEHRDLSNSDRFRRRDFRYEPTQQPDWAARLTLYPVCSETLIAPREHGLHIHLLGSVGLQRLPASTTDVGAIAVTRSGLPTLGAMLPVWYDARLRRSIFQMGAGGSVDLSRSAFDMAAAYGSLGLDLSALSLTRGNGWPFVAVQAGVGVRYKGLIQGNIQDSYLVEDPVNRRGLYLGLLVTTKLGPVHASIYARYFNRLRLDEQERDRREDLREQYAATGLGGDGSDGRPPDQLRLGVGIDLYATISSLVELGLGRGARRP